MRLPKYNWGLFCATEAEMKYVSFGKKHVKYKSKNKHGEEFK